MPHIPSSRLPWLPPPSESRVVIDSALYRFVTCSFTRLPCLHSRYGLSEGILPEQRAHILGGFVEPRLALTKGEPSLIPWGELREQNYLLVSGAPGSGKTTLLRHWLLWHADRTRRGDATVLPLCVSLRHFTSSDTMESSLRREAVEMGAPWLGRDLRAYARRGMLAVAFDGLDEVPAEYRNLAMRSISEFTRSFPYCRYLVTTRPQVGIQLDVGLLRADLLPLDRSRCRQLAYHRLYETKSWKTFTAKVEAEPALDWVVGNPLALSLIIARFLRHEITPSYVTEIIAGVVDMFVDGWDASRGVVRTKNRNLSPAEKRKILGKFAARRKLEVSDGDATPLASEINAGYGEEKSSEYAKRAYRLANATRPRSLGVPELRSRGILPSDRFGFGADE